METNKRIALLVISFALMATTLLQLARSVRSAEAAINGPVISVHQEGK